MEVVVSQYNKNLPSLSKEFSRTPESSCSSLLSFSSFCLNELKINKLSTNK